MAANAFTTNSGNLIVTDRVTKTRYLVDTGSDLCVFPRKHLPERRARIDYSRRDFTWRFVVAEVELPIIGVEFLSHFNLLVDCKNRLLDGITSLFTQCNSATHAVPSIKAIAGNATPDSLLAEFPSLTRPIGIHREVHHNTTHHIRTTPGPPVACRPRRLGPDRLAVAKADFDAMMRDGTARRAEGTWSSALHLVPKDNGWRPCGDYRALIDRTSLTGILFHTFKIMPITFLVVQYFPKLTS
jgi:hypothetical protein